jgi:undecaprenyl-diphosphatase
MAVDEAAATTERPMVRHTDDLIIAAGALVLLGALAVPVHRHSVSGVEADIFAAINGHTLLPYTLVWAGMQLGNLFFIPVAAVAAAVTRRYRLATGLLIAGTGVYFGAKIIKRIIMRGRPSTVLHDVVIRGPAPKGLGFVSGHAAVITALAMLAWPWLGRRGKVVAVVAVVWVMFARMYVGAHLPLDMVGGALLGLAAACIVRFAFGRPTPLRTIRPSRSS